jgi:hypothetical protein
MLREWLAAEQQIRRRCEVGVPVSVDLKADCGVFDARCKNTPSSLITVTS